MQLGIKHDTAETNPMNGIRRAVCGKTARTVRRGGDRFIPALYSTHFVEYHCGVVLILHGVGFRTRAGGFRGVCSGLPRVQCRGISGAIPIA